MQELLLVGAAMVVCGVIGLGLGLRGSLPMVARSHVTTSAYAVVLASLLTGGMVIVAVNMS